MAQAKLFMALPGGRAICRDRDVYILSDTVLLHIWRAVLVIRNDLSEPEASQGLFYHREFAPDH